MNYIGEYNFRYCDSLKGNLFLSIEKDIINNETPYQMVFKCISNDGDNFIFPKIKFGISDDTVYIYAIQNKKNEDNSFCKKINRVLYRVGEGFQLDTSELDENFKDITASFLVSLNMGISFLFNNGFNKIVVPSILVERWNAKCISNKLKIEKKKLNDSDIRDLEDKHDILQQNLTNKLIRTFLRMGCHYNNIDIISFPYEVDSCLNIYLNNNDIICNNSLLYETYKLVEDSLGNKRIR